MNQQIKIVLIWIGVIVLLFAGMIGWKYQFSERFFTETQSIPTWQLYAIWFLFVISPALKMLNDELSREEREYEKENPKPNRKAYRTGKEYSQACERWEESFREAKARRRRLEEGE